MVVARLGSSLELLAVLDLSVGVEAVLGFSGGLVAWLS